MLLGFPIKFENEHLKLSLQLHEIEKRINKTSDCSAIDVENDQRQNVQNFAVKPLNSAPSSTWDVVAMIYKNIDNGK